MPGLKDAIMDIPKLKEEVKSLLDALKIKFSETPDINPPPDPKPSTFVGYLSSDKYLKGAEDGDEDKEFPWDECIAEQKESGADDPDAVCAAIKNRTVKNMIESKAAKDVKEAVSLVQQAVKSNAVAAYLSKKLLNKKPDQSPDITGLEKRIGETEGKLQASEKENQKNIALLKQTFALVEKIAEMPTEQSQQRKRDGAPNGSEDNVSPLMKSIRTELSKI